MSRDRNIQGVVPLQNQTYLCKGTWSVDQKVINGHKNPSDSHNNHDENPDGIEFYLGNSRSTWWHSTLEQRTPKNQSDWLYSHGVLLTNVQCHRYLYPYHDIENTGTYNWKHTWNHTVSNHPIHQHVHTNFWYVCLFERVYFNRKNAAILCGMYIINGVHGQNQGRQEETHHPTHRFRCLFLDLLWMGWRGCASAMGVIKTPILLF